MLSAESRTAAVSRVKLSTTVSSGSGDEVGSAITGQHTSSNSCASAATPAMLMTLSTSISASSSVRSISLAFILASAKSV